MKKPIEGLHHFHIRKRVHQKHESYPHPHKWKRFMDKAIYVAGVFGPLMTLPQLTKIWIEKNAAGVSVISWASYLIAAIFWLIYGIMHKEKPIIFAYSLWIGLEILIVVGTIIYG
ncbi:MAG: PQ-loop domain-containing transporter [Candidatus Woesearchaeota archaeon]|nr:PQ-loop domain-containing transporter [Candidatus Woesearchaeota archaeon]MDP7322987.1 PQ-loop domain-containing transporter [Candidatus Woesearchaeota archaeon]MDP7476735.1 PQ-loop domain-containing transporter [Candidatus Woesearchaeota archaeon]HJO01876.1 PQ-loop domain-containing transporter [Candidatus Woesearchaeota archaeon]|tara:strand:+ start:183 stop:527 length:345 start_codon:yes stop_codon:yes gene_type:complete